MSSKQSIRKRGRINVVACNRCKRDKKKCDGSYLTQKPCKYCRDRNEYCEYTEPNRLKSNKIQSDDEVMVVGSSNISNIVNGCETPSNQRQDIPLQQKLIDNDLCKSDLFLQLLTDPSTTNEQTIILKRLYNEVMKNPEDPKFNGNKRDELCMKLKLLTSSNDDHHTKIQIWEDLCSLVNEIDKIITANCEENNPTNILDSFFENFNSWNSETLGFSSTTIRTTTTELQSTTSPRRVESQQSNLTFSNDLTNQLDVMNPSTVLNNQQPVHETVPKVRKNKKVVEVIVSENKKTNSKKRKNRKIQKGNNKRTQPYPAGGQIVIRPTKQAHTMIWHQNDPIEDVPIMAFHLRPPTPPTPPAARPSQRSHFQRPPPPSFAHFQPMVPPIPINLWDHSTAMTMLSPKPNSSFSESEINNEETLPATNSILLSPTPSLHDDVGDIVSSPSNSSIDHARVVSDDEKDHFGLISLTQSTESPQSPSLFTMEDFIEMWSNSSTVTDDLSVVEPIWNC